MTLMKLRQRKAARRIKPKIRKPIDKSKSLRHNERKFFILSLLAKASIHRKYLYAGDIARKAGLPITSISKRLGRLYRLNYIYRRVQRFDKRGGHKGQFEYCFLKNRGHRVLQELWIRSKLREIDPRVVLNLKHSVPPDLAKLYQQYSLEYNNWLQQLGNEKL